MRTAQSGELLSRQGAQAARIRPTVTHQQSLYAWSSANFVMGPDPIAKSLRAELALHRLKELEHSAIDILVDDDVIEGSFVTRLLVRNP